MNSIVPSRSDSDNRSIVIYNPDPDTSIEFPLDIERRTVWATQRKIAETLRLDVSTVNRHITNFKEQRGTAANQTIAKFTIVAEDGKAREVEHYNMTVITYVGFRAQATEIVIAFQDWVGQILEKAIQPKPMSPGELLAVQAQMMIAMEQRIEAQDHAIAQLHAADEYHTHEIETIKDRLDRADFHTVKAWCDLQRIPYTISLLQKWGRDAATLSREYQVEIVKLETPGAKYPTINVYHKSILLLICVPKQKPTRQLTLLD